MREIDIKRDATSDLLDSANWDKIFTEITAGDWDVLLLSPPCSTWSRARFRYAGKFGAKPLRSSTYVWGFPWLEASQRELADRGNFFIHQCIRAVQLQLSVGKFFLWEHPEDLGATSQGDHPASIWQLPEVRALGANAATWAIHQCNFGGSSSKPTRLLSNLPAALPLHMGWPKFATSGAYSGPLPRCHHKWHEPLVGWQGDTYRTSGAEAYPPPLCQYFANLIISPLQMLSSTEDLHVSTALPSAEDLAKLLPPGRLTNQDVASLVPLLELEEPHLATGQKAGGAFFAGAYAKGGLVGLRKSCHSFPSCVRVFARLLAQTFPGLPFTSLAIFVNVQTQMHKDIYNAPFDNLAIGLSNFTHGEIWCERSSGTVERLVKGVPTKGVLLDVAQRPCVLPAHECFHATEAWEGNRVVLIGFSVRHIFNLPADQLQLLRDLGFQLPSAPVAQGEKGAVGGQPVADTSSGPVIRDPWGSAAVSHSRASQSGADTPSGPVIRDPVDHSGCGAMDLMTLGHEFQCTEGLVVVSDSESDKEVNASASLGPAPPASPLEPGFPKLADGMGLGKQAVAAGVEPFDPFTSRAFGQPLTCRHAKEPHEFVDGLGLCSPGRWRPEQRGRLCSWGELCHAEGLQRCIRNFVLSELDDVKTMSFKLAAGRIESSPFKPESMQRLREELASLTPDPQLSLTVPERQPFYLHLLAQSLRELGDPDWAILTQGEECFAQGVPLGDVNPLGRVPQVFRARVKERRLDESEYNPDMVNYSSAELSGDQLEEHFRKEESLGRMYPSTEAAIAEEFGAGKLLVSAMGALQKPNGDVRPLHDGTHGVQLNNSIKVLDRLEVPGPDEILECVAVAQEAHEAVFGISADISSAHRLVLIRKSDWPKLGCRARSHDRVIWLNTVGTFGISSAAYWWCRLFGCIGRWVVRLMMSLWAMQMIYVDDLHLVAAGPQKYLVLWMMIAAYEAIGTPFAYHKFKGGLRIDFIGYHLSYDSWSAGLSEKRCRWVVDWIDRAEANGWMVLGRHFIELTGRLTFVGQVLRWMKPFLSPLHSWAAVLARGTVARMPLLVHVALVYIRSQLCKGRRLLQPALAQTAKPKQAFRTDAKCADGYVVLGGWALPETGGTENAPWFSLKIFPKDAPWLFKEDGSSQWASTSAEFLGTMAALKAFGWLEAGEQGRDWTTLIYAGTDNRSNPQALRKGGSVSWPLMGLMMQMADVLIDIGGKLRLHWRPREENQEADNLTNEVFDGFDANRRVALGFGDLPLDLFLSLQNAYADFDQKRKDFKMVNPVKTRTSKKIKLAEKTAW